MGTMGSKIESQQVLLVGLEKSGKTLFLKKLLELRKADSEDNSLESTNGYNFVNFTYLNCFFDVWDLGGDPISRSYWPTFYRNLKFTILLFFIDIFDKNSHNSALKELLILANEEELKHAKIFIVFNIVLDETQKLLMNESSYKEIVETAESLMSIFKDCPVHDYDTRIQWEILDVSKMKEGENKTTALLTKCLLGNIESKIRI